MGTWIAEQITCKLIAASVIEEGDRELYSYGFFLLISKIFFLFVAVIAGLLTDTTVESIIFYVVFMLLRTYAGGIHARTEMSCTVLTTLALIATVLVIKQLEMHTSGAISLLMFGIGSLCILVFSPLDTDGKPLDKHEKRQYKTVCIAILIIYVIVALIAWEQMLGATIHITLSPRQMFALLGIPQIRPQLVMSLIMHASTPEDNH